MPNFINGTNASDKIGAAYGTTNGGDFIRGFDREDTIHGLGGHDGIVGGKGTDVMGGGTGIDKAAYGKSARGVTVDLNTGLGDDGNAEGDLFVKTDDITGSHHGDTLFGNNQDNVLNGLAGEDILKGSGGTDTLWGGDDDDALFGGDGVDTLHGGLDNDRLTGGKSLDYLYGDAGADNFVWNTTDETASFVLIADVIWDFNAVEGDLIDLSGIDADVVAVGNQAFTFIGTAAFSGAPGELRYYHAGNVTCIEMQTGTSVDVESVIRLAGIHTPEASWFVL